MLIIRLEKNPLLTPICNRFVVRRNNKYLSFQRNVRTGGTPDISAPARLYRVGSRNGKNIGLTDWFAT